MAEPEADILIRLETPSGEVFDAPFGSDTQEFFLQSKDLDAGLEQDGRVIQDPRASKHIYKVLAKIKNKGGSNLRMNLYYRNKLSEDRRLYKTLDLTKDDEMHKLRMPGAKYVSFRLYAQPVGSNFAISELKFEGVLGGNYR